VQLERIIVQLSGFGGDVYQCCAVNRTLQGGMRRSRIEAQELKSVNALERKHPCALRACSLLLCRQAQPTASATARLSFCCLIGAPLCTRRITCISTVIARS
jgi:hypothetical protein